LVTILKSDEALHSPDNIPDGLESPAPQIQNLQNTLLHRGGAAAADLQDDVVDELQLEETALQPEHKNVADEKP